MFPSTSGAAELQKMRKGGLTMKYTTVFCAGDSHSMILCDGNDVFENFALIDLHQIATSISGLNNPRSKLRYGDFLRTRLPFMTKNDYVVFKLGAVDMEYIYYYKKCLSDKDIPVGEFTDHLVREYERYIVDNRIVERTNLIISALHLPSYYSDEYLQTHIPKICVGIESCDQSKLREVEEWFRRLAVTRRSLTVNNLLLNDKLRLMCERLNAVYFDTTAFFIDSSTGLLRENIVGAPPPGNRYHNGDHHYKSICDRTDMGPQTVTRRALINLIRTKFPNPAPHQPGPSAIKDGSLKRVTPEPQLAFA
jgi:hypothetical protein